MRAIVPTYFLLFQLDHPFHVLANVIDIKVYLEINPFFEICLQFRKRLLEIVQLRLQSLSFPKFSCRS
jgi:hypothetical protein